MYYDEYFIIRNEVVEEIKTKLNIIRLQTDDKYIKDKVEEIFQMISTQPRDEALSVEELIYRRMNETKNSNDELSVNLYMLYRKLQDKKIDPTEALHLYNAYNSK